MNRGKRWSSLGLAIITVTGIGLLDAEYDDFLVNTGTSAVPVIVDFSNLDIRRAPDLTASLVGDYEWEAGPGRAAIHAGLRSSGRS